MITARSAFQIYKAEEASGSVSDFNSLAIEDVLPYKIASAEETLLASLDIVETDAEHRARYAVSTLHAAAAYVSHLISYVPLSARSQTAKKIDIHYDALVRTVMIFCSQDAGLFAAVKNMVVRSAPADQVSLKELSDVEGALTAMEKEYRQKAKDAGERVDMLRKVAPEPPVVVVATTASSSSLPLTPPPSGDASAAAGTSPGKRRPRSQSGDAAGNAAEAAEGEGSELKATRVEGEAAATTAAAATRTAGKSRRTKAGGGPASAAAGVGGLVWGRLRALTPNEKKAVAVLHTIVQVLAHVYATRVNDLVPLFDLLEEKVKTVQAIIDTERAQYEVKEDKKPPEPFHEVDLTALSAALATSSHLFRTDEECRYELDEDLLHPIAHACLTVMNHIEGYATAPFVPPSPEELDKKQQLRDAARVKREEAKRRILEKAEAKAELERKREEEKQLMRRRLGDHDPDEDDDRLVEDMVLANPSPLGYVAYAADLPLGSAALYEQALFVWSMIVSVPRALNLSQMHFDTFLRGIQCEDQDANGFMEEVTRCLLEVSMEAVRIGSPNTPRITTRGKNWFDALVEFVGVASGTKQKRRQQQRRREPSVEEEEEEEEEEESSTDSTSEEEDGDGSSESSDSGTEAVLEQEQEPQRSSDANTSPTTAAAAEETAPTAEDVAAAAKPEEVEEVDTDPFMEELKATMDNITRLRALATWGNVDACDRLNLLRFCVQEALSSEGVRAEADRLQKEVEEEVGVTERRLKEIRDEAEKELKALLRTLPAATASVSGGAATRRTGRSRKAAAVKKEGEKNDEDHDADNDSEKDGDDEDAREATYEAEREAILQAVDRRRAEVHASVFGKQDGQDNGAVVEPIGMDRYKRLYWRFPLQRDIFVQTAPELTHTPFPVLPEPAELRRKATSTRALLLDEEDVLSSTRSKGRSTPPPPPLKAESADDAAQSAVTTQTEWGVIPAAYLATFAQTLDRRGRREGPLRHALETLVPYLSHMEEAKEARTTRARATMFGYYNQLKTDFSY